MSASIVDVTAAIAAKLAASSVCATAGLRKADADEGDPLVPPHIRVGNASWELIDRPSAWTERLRLTIPAVLLVERPDGAKRKQATVDALSVAVRGEFQTGIKLGLPGYVDECYITAFSTADLGDYAETELIGGTFTFVVEVTETLSTPRTA